MGLYHHVYFKEGINHYAERINHYARMVFGLGSKHKKRSAARRPGESTETPKDGNGHSPEGTTIQFNRWKQAGPDSGGSGK